MVSVGDPDLTQVKAWVNDKLVPFVQGNKKLAGELDAANKDRASWAAFTEDYKGWNPDDAEKNKTTYAYAEYVWSVKKDKDFRNKHISSAAGEIKEFQKGSGGVITEFFVTDAKGGNVAQSQVASDWFQGDEPKFKDCTAKSEIAFGKPQRDDTVGETGIHVSVPIVDGDEKLIGVAIVLVIVEKVK